MKLEAILLICITLLISVYITTEAWKEVQRIDAEAVVEVVKEGCNYKDF